MSNLKSVSNGTPVLSASKSFVVPATPVQGQGVFFSDDFSGDLSGWDEIGANVSIDNTGGINNSRHLKIAYRGKGTGPYVVKKNVSSLNLSEVYVKFNFRQNGTHSGSKFLKLFGKQNDPVGNANTTFAMQYSNNDLERVSFGNGDATANDTQSTIKYDGGKTSNIPEVIINTSTSKFVMPIDEWHEYQAYMKYNSNGNRDGVYKVWIDGVLRLHATNIKNRHDSNSREFSQIRIADYNNSADSNYDLRYDNVVMSTQFIT